MEKDLLPSLIRREERERQAGTRPDFGGAAAVTHPQTWQQKKQQPERRTERLPKEQITVQPAEQQKMEQNEHKQQTSWTQDQTKIDQLTNRILRREYITEYQEVTIPVKTIFVKEEPEMFVLPAKHEFDESELNELKKDVHTTRNLSPVTLPQIEKRISLKSRKFVQPIVTHVPDLQEMEGTPHCETVESIKGPFFTVLPSEERWLPDQFEESHETVRDKVEIDKQIFITRVKNTTVQQLEPQTLPSETQQKPPLYISASQDEFYTATVPREEKQQRQQQQQQQQQRQSEEEKEERQVGMTRSSRQQPAEEKQPPQKQQAPPAKKQSRSEKSKSSDRISLEEESSAPTEPPHGMTLSDIASE